ncbi:MAG: hypothetical protein DRJ29_16455 [Bacteroidetes bacterium]|nr:MAG: hypothetical protein DRJ29_16455 [Bacteroidota bacterium]
MSSKNPVSFSLHLRIPGWCSNPELKINGEKASFEVEEGMVVLDRTWQEGDLVELQLPMKVSLNRWVENSVSVERGPLVYALKIREEWSAVESDDIWGDFNEVRPLDPWNIGLLEAAVLDPETGFEFVTNGEEGDSDADQQEGQIYPWTLENAPVALRTKGRIIPDWKLNREMAGPLPHSLPLKHLMDDPPREITLIPYGCSTLRITEFPVVR